MLRATTGHIYRVSDLLGRGASCHVYKGVDKKSGKERALKIFNVALPPQWNEALKREVDALKTLGHPNIVTFLSLETEVSSGHKVLVMELCTGGTLLTVLGEPHNAFGLSEEEFLLFLAHIVSGLKHLRLNGFVHRDIKPGNILRSIGEDGKSVYKLSDFGSAKKLNLDEEQFMSMYGTEEYLHPDIFEKAFIDRSADKQFTLAVDLWSIGATLYHAVTGTVPFRPYGGRRDKETMFEMIAQKDTGIISGVQESPKGEISWSKQLPNTCSVSENLKTVVRGMCAGMMERNPNRMWTFETFFVEAERLFEKQRIFVFSTLDCSLNILYLRPKEHLSDLQREISRLLKIDQENQVLFWKEKPIAEHVTKDSEIVDFPKTDSSRPIIVFGMCSMEGWPLTPVTIAEFPPLVKDGGGFDADFRTAKQSWEVLCGLKKIMDQCRISQEFLCSGAAAFRLHIISQISHLRERIEREITANGQALKSMDIALRMLKSTCKEESVDRQSYDFGDAGSLGAQLCGDLQTITASLTKIIKELEETRLWCDHTREELGGYLPPEKALEMNFGLKLCCPDDCECVSSVKWQLGELKTLTQKMDERRRHGRIAYHEEQLHTFDKRHLVEVCEKSWSLLHDHCLPANEKVFLAFKSWHRVFYPKMLDLHNQRIKVEQKSKEVETLQSQYHKIQTGMMSKYLKTPATSIGVSQTSLITDQNRQRRHQRVKALESSLLESANDPLSVRQEMASLQESLTSMVESLEMPDEPEILSFEEVLQ